MSFEWSQTTVRGQRGEELFYCKSDTVIFHACSEDGSVQCERTVAGRLQFLSS